MEKEKKYNTIEETLSKGCICAAYGSKYLFSVNPAPNIHKVRFSIVELNTGGKSALDFYMSMDDMRRFVREIDNGMAARKIEADKASQYPSAYKFTTGKDGSKHLNIGGGQKGIRVQIQVAAPERKYMLTVVSMTQLEDMAFYFKLVMGLIPCTDYYANLKNRFWEGQKERASKFASSTYNAENDSDYHPTADDSTNSAVVNTPTEQPASRPVELRYDGDTVDLEFSISGNLEKKRDDLFAINAVNKESGEISTMYFDNDSKALIGEKWSKLENLGDRAFSIKAHVIKKGSDYLFRGFVA